MSRIAYAKPERVEIPSLLSKEQRDKVRDLQRQIDDLQSEDKSVRRKATKEAARKRKEALSRVDGQRQPRVLDKGFLAFLRRQPCEACGTTRRVEAAHVRSGYPEAGWRPTGMQEKPDDRRALPLCASDHRLGPKAQHGGNERAYWQSLGIYPPARCAELYAAYEAQPWGMQG